MTPGARAGVTSAEGLVLSHRNVGESDRVLDVLLRGRGRTDVWIKAARSARRSPAAALGPFASSRFSLRPRTDGFTCTGHDELAPRAGLRTRLSALRRAGQLVHLFRALWPKHEAADRALDTLEVALDHLCAGRVARAAGAYPRLLWAAGLMPSLDACHRCRAPFGPRAAPVLDEAGLACTGCRPRERALPLAALRALGGERVAEQSLAAALEQAVLHWASWHVGAPLALSFWGTDDGAGA